MKIIFSMPASFFRTEKKTNPFFDPIIRACEDAGFEWLVVSPCSNIGIGYSKAHFVDGRFLDVASLIIWKVAKLIGCANSSDKVYRVAGRILGLFSRRLRGAGIVIKIAGQFSDQLKGMNPRARLVDVQHGVVYSHHRGYFDVNGVANLVRNVNGEVWLYGQGYADCFFKNPENHKWLDGRVKVIGDVVRAGARDVGLGCLDGLGGLGGGERNLVVFSLQLTTDLDEEERAASVRGLEKFFEAFFAKFGNKYECYIKHHPRFNNCFDLADFYKKFPQVKECKEPWSDLYPKMALHVTFNSTVSFDCASAGVPTCLPTYEGARVLDNGFYRDDYEYPYHGKTAEEILSIPFEESSKVVHDWYLRFYTPFSEENCLKLLRGEV